jgi:hypothetical protein
MKDANKHTAGPWRFDPDSFLPEEWYLDGTITANGKLVAAAITTGGLHALKESEANARRIVACVNACEGLPDKALQYLPDYAKERDRLAALNRELVEALEDVLRDRLTQANLHQMPPAMRARLEKARAIPAKCRT